MNWKKWKIENLKGKQKIKFSQKGRLNGQLGKRIKL